MKKIKYILFALFIMLCTNKVKAAGSLSGPSSVTVGDRFTVSATVSGVASWNVHVSASGPVSGCVMNYADTTPSATNGSKTYSASCSATGTGTITLTLSGDTTTAEGKTSILGGTKNINVNPKAAPKPTVTPTKPATPSNPVVTKTAEPKDTRSTNNNLKSLSVEGYEISPKFDKDKKEYTLRLSYDVTKINIKAEKDSSKASLSGNGEKEVKVGENNFEIKVKAENGDIKTYKLKVIVDSKPIKVTIDGKEYTVIKKKEELPELKINHEDRTLNLEEQDVPAYRIESVKYTLIGLQDSEGNKSLCRFKSYKADEQPAEYNLFNPISLSEMYINIENFDKNKVPTGYSEFEEEINGVKTIVYKLDKDSKYSLIYGTNINNGISNIYKYNSEEKTIQLYEREEAKKLDDTIEQGKKLIMILAGVILFLIILTTIGFSRKPKVKKKKEVKKISDELTEKDIKNIEKDTSKSNKKELKRQKKLAKQEKKSEKRRQKKGEPEL